MTKHTPPGAETSKAPEDWVQVDCYKHYNPASYLSPTRMASIGYQIRFMNQHFPGANVLEVGVGSGLAAQLLRKLGHQVTTLDVDVELSPDVVGSVTEIPVETGAFASFLCCQVLEHLPWEDSRMALEEIRRVTKLGGVISVPTVRPRLGLRVYPFRRGHPTRMLPGLWPKSRQLHTPDEHYWELGIGVSLRQFREACAEAAFQIVEELQPIENPYHHFFVLKAVKEQQS